MSRGEIWPKPVAIASKETVLVIHPKNFKIRVGEILRPENRLPYKYFFTVVRYR
jgi:hypothetical protein